MDLPSSTADHRELIDSLPQIVWSSPPNEWPDYFNQRWFEYTGLPAPALAAPKPGEGGSTDTPDTRHSTLDTSPSASRIQHPESSIHPESPPPWSSLIHPEDLPGFVAEWQTALQSGAPFGLMSRLRRDADGQFRWHLARGNPIRNTEGKITRWVGTLTDVEDRVEAEENLKRNAADLARSNAELEQFASAVSHDLQEPPRQVASVIQILLEHPERLNSETAKWLGVAFGGTKRMQQLINGLLDFARLGTKLKPFAPVDCQAVYEAVVAKLNSKIQENSARVTSSPLPSVRGDDSALARLFENLLDNALKFRSKESPVIRVQAERLGNQWRFEVRDNGVGIPPNCVRRLFILFQRFHSLAEYPGIGLGLPISKKIVELHHGRIWSEPVTGGGTSFFFTLPASD